MSDNDVLLDDIDLDDVDMDNLELPDVDADATAPVTAEGVGSEAQSHPEKSHRSKKDKKHKKEKKEMKHKKRRTEGGRRKSSRFVDDAAGEDDDDEDDEDDGSADEGDDGGLIDENEAREVQRAQRIADEQRRKARELVDNDVSAEEAARAIEERYKQQQRHRKAGGGGSVTLEDDGEVVVPRLVTNLSRFAANYLPKASDPKVFAIKCRPKMNRTLVARIVNKCYCYRMGLNHERKKIDLGIISCFALDNIKDYIYVEASRQLFVENALNGLVGLFRFNISELDRGELMQLLEPRPINKDVVKIGSFVRPKRGDYKGDIGQVIAVDGSRLIVKFVPREDFTGKPYNKPENRQPQKFFSPQLTKGAVVERDGSTRWGDLKFDAEGYIILSFTARTISFGLNMILPSVNELAIFYGGNADKVRVASAIQQRPTEPAAVAAAAVPTQTLHVGEIVRVVSGQLAGTVGKIVDIILSTQEVKIDCRIPNQQRSVVLRVELKSVVKYFTEGDHIVVERGNLCGESGNVLQATGEEISFVTDSNGTIATAFANECKQSNLSHNGKTHTVGGVKLYDLVRLNGHTGDIFCVVKIHESDVVVLSTDNVAKRTPARFLEKPFTQGPLGSRDKMSNPLRTGCEVRFVGSTAGGPASAAKIPKAGGTVVQLHHDHLFVRCLTLHENSGVVAVKSKDVLLVGGKTSRRAVEQPRQLPQFEKKAHMATNARDIAPGADLTYNDVHSAAYMEVE